MKINRSNSVGCVLCNASPRLSEGHEIARIILDLLEDLLSR